MIVKLPQNGFGLRYGANINAEMLQDDLWFYTAPQVFEDLSNQQTMVLGGEPGAGKSHITADLFQLGYNAGLGCVMLSCHINAGNKKGRTQTAETFAAAQDIGSDAIVALDNLDFTIYTGGLKRRRTNAHVAEYCSYISELVMGCVDAGCMIVATTHSDAWRMNHSDADLSTKQQFADLVKNLGGEKQFQGDMSLENITRILLKRSIEQETANRIADSLQKHNALLFRQAYHIDPAIFLTSGIEHAMNDVDSVKNQKIQGGA